MKKIFVLTTLIAGILITMACGNSIAPKEQAVAEFVKKDSLQFTPEEIAYNDSVKDIPQAYTIVDEYATINDLENPSEIELEIYQIPVFLTQKEAYIKSYNYLCGGVLSVVSSYVRVIDFVSEYFTYKYSIKILNENGKDITPLIDFPERRIIEDSIWNSTIDFITKEGIIGTIDMYHQPIFNKGDTMAIEWDIDFLKNLH